MRRLSSSEVTSDNYKFKFPSIFAAPEPSQRMNPKAEVVSLFPSLICLFHFLQGLSRACWPATVHMQSPTTTTTKDMSHPSRTKRWWRGLTVTEKQQLPTAWPTFPGWTKCCTVLGRVVRGLADCSFPWSVVSPGTGGVSERRHRCQRQQEQRGRMMIGNAKVKKKF